MTIIPGTSPVPSSGAESGAHHVGEEIPPICLTERHEGLMQLIGQTICSGGGDSQKQGIAGPPCSGSRAKRPVAQKSQHSVLNRMLDFIANPLQ